MGEVFAGPGFRTCSRSGCRWPAVSTLAFDYSGRRAWVDELMGTGRDPATYDLCSVHADRFAPPTGWEFEDRREPDRPRIAPVDADSGDLKKMESLRSVATAASSSQPQASPRARTTKGKGSQGKPVPAAEEVPQKSAQGPSS